MKNLMISTCLFGLFLANGCAAGLIAGSAAISATSSQRQPAAQSQPAPQQQPARPQQPAHQPPIASSQSTTATQTETPASQPPAANAPVPSQQAEPTQGREAESAQTTSVATANEPVKAEAQADAGPPVDRAKLRKEARAAAAQLESLTLKVVAAFAKGKGNCSKVTANLRSLEGTAEKSRTAIDAAKTRAETDAAFRLEWEQALDQVSKRMEPKLGELKARVGACKDDPEVRALLGAVYPRV